MIQVEFGKAENQKLESNSIFIKFPYGSSTFKTDLEKIKGYWNRVYLPKTKEWEVPYTDETLLDIQELYNNDIQYLNERPRRVSSTEINNFLENYDWGKFKPYPYQLDGIKFGLQHRNWLLGDTMGLGKSFQTIHLANIYKQMGKIKHCLVICCINSLKYNWLNEIHKFTNNDAIVLGTRKGKTDKTKDKLFEISIEETKEQIKGCPSEFFWIINIEKLRCSKEDLEDNTSTVDYLNEQIANGNLGMIIIDEIHTCKNPKAIQSIQLQRLDNKALKVGMSGTLVVNNPMNLYVPMWTVGLITSNYYVFSNRYMLKDRFGAVYGFQNMEELQTILHKSFIRRKKEEVAKDLPPVIINNEILEMSNEEYRVFQELIKGAETDSLLDKIDAPNTIMALITRMRQCTTNTGLISSKIEKSTKFERLKDILDEAKFNNEKVLVFCQFTQAIEIAMEYFKEYNPKKIIGGMGQEIMNIVKEHEESNGFSVIFAQTQTLGVGHSLPNTSNVVFLSLLWDYATFEQCYNRCHRITSTKPVTVTNLIMKDTYDESIYNLIYAKKAMGDMIVDKKEIDACMEYIRRLGIEFLKGNLPEDTKLFK